MFEDMRRRDFLRKTMAGAAGATIGLKLAGAAEEKAQTSTEKKTEAVTAAGAKGMPTGKIGNLTVSRLVSGGNLISGWAHSRDLMYVDDLMREYNTDTKVMDTMQLLEENGVNTIIADPSERPFRIFPKYWKERGGKMQWIAEGHPKPEDLETNIKKSVEIGAKAIYIQGVIGDRWLKEGRLELLGKCMEVIKSQGVPAGIGAHKLDVIVRSEAEGYGAEFYVKTLHQKDYWSAKRPEQNEEVIDNRADNYWCTDAEETIEFMKEIKKPWVAFKVLAAGAIHPKNGFKYAFEGGADFVCAGMFDFQVLEDVAIAKRILGSEMKRQRGWMG